ncbi:radical SAM protein [Actinomadura barringtoniae]|uniref:Radical SAM protein n=1 Tax=Actinomadura barringtoniae TaxID=1427535 RepID=A0A939T9P7_9ACTN|nr:radical SAM protein [Actinomadura barringtoniae]MBO2455378.1 radical SAM protein [Actinomadura barringtoniae]
MHDLIASPANGEHVVLRPGSRQALRIGERRFRELEVAVDCPSWLVDASRRAWSLNLLGRPIDDTVIVRKPTSYGFVRATHEVNLGCNYDCEHCYLGLKRFEGMTWPERERMLGVLRDVGVLWLQLTGGEPMIDRLFPEVYAHAYDLGMMIDILSNGSRLRVPRVLELLTKRPAHRITVSVYGATTDSYDALTRRPGAFRLFCKGMAAGTEAGLPLALSLIVTRHNADELGAMKDLADRLGLPYEVYSNMSPTIHGGAETLPSQSVEHLRKRKPFTGCNAGHTFFHVDPHGKASICKIGREPNVDLLTEGADGLRGLGEIADGLLLRQGGCTGCQLQGTCGTCMPLVQLYRKAESPLATYCQHRDPREEESAE